MIIKLTNQAAQLLLSAATEVRWPARLGSGTDYDLVFDDQDRAGKMMQISELRTTLRTKYATKVESEYRTGPQDNWRPKANAPGQWELIDRDLSLSVDLEWPAYHAIYWLLLWVAHPASPGYVKGGFLEEIVYPLIREREEMDQLLYDLGLKEDEPAVAPIRQTLTAAAKSPSRTGNGHG